MLIGGLTMPYNPNFVKSPDQLIIEQINYDNGTTYDTSHAVINRDAEAIFEEFANTRLTVWVDHDADGPLYAAQEFILDFKRIDLSTLFSVVDINLKEQDITDTGIVINNRIHMEILRKYGIYVSDKDFYIDVDTEGALRLYAKDDNPAYIGSVPILVSLTMLTEITAATLEMLAYWDDKDVKKFLKKLDLSGSERLDILNKVDAYRATYAIDFTDIRELLALNPDGTFARYGELVEYMQLIGLPTFSEDLTAAWELVDKDTQALNRSYDWVVTTDFYEDLETIGAYVFHVRDE